MIVEADHEAKVFLRRAKYDCDGGCDKDDLCTSKIYTVINDGKYLVKIITAEGDKFSGDFEELVLEAGNRVTFQNYKKTFYLL